MRQFADSWGLIFMVLLMVGILAWTFRPGAKQHHEDARMIPLRDEEAEE